MQLQHNSFWFLRLILHQNQLGGLPGPLKTSQFRHLPIPKPRADGNGENVRNAFHGAVNPSGVAINPVNWISSTRYFSDSAFGPLRASHAAILSFRDG